ncbi:MAG TPA: hypothetical protein VG166_04755 [Caulobacteraceae bacterium]|nr:hypothetical protein [Caulobacteraceae bacterium]
MPRRAAAVQSDPARPAATRAWGRRLLWTLAAIGALLVIWRATARDLSMAIDPLWRVPIVTLKASPIGWDGRHLQVGAERANSAGVWANWRGPRAGIGAYPLWLEDSGPQYAPVVSATGGDRLVLTYHGRSFVLGRRAGTMEGGDGPIPAYAAEPGDHATLAIQSSLIDWPVTELNFMTGASPTWRRHLYYHLVWTKSSGARLDLLWRFEQGYYPQDGWTAPGDRDHVTGLIQVEIRPPSP